MECMIKTLFTMTLHILIEWLGCQDSNLGIAVPKTAALPLGHTRIEVYTSRVLYINNAFTIHDSTAVVNMKSPKSIHIFANCGRIR